jgi:hypothetical protein
MSPVNGVCVVSVPDPFKLLLSTAAQNQKNNSGAARNINSAINISFVKFPFSSSTKLQYIADLPFITHTIFRISH